MSGKCDVSGLFWRIGQGIGQRGRGGLVWGMGVEEEGRKKRGNWKTESLDRNWVI